KRANEDDNIQLKQQVGMDICSIKEERICNYCKKKGHIIKDCKKLKWKNTQQSRNVDFNENFEDVGKTDMNKSVSDKNELKLKIRIANNDILALLDTGSTVNLVNSKYASNIEKVKDINLKSANGTTMKVLGKTTLEFRYRDLAFRDEFIITDDIRIPMILGYPFCREEKLFLEFNEVIKISLAKERLRDAGLGEHRIVTTCATPVAAHCYRRSIQETKEIEKNC
ncbi:hypothetical protein NGRA_3488, partial [Nosema granulosis]